MKRLSRRDFVLTGLGGLGALALPSCLIEGDYKRPLEMSPQDLGDGWTVATLRDVGLDPVRVRAMVARVFSEHDFANALSVLLIRDGLLVAEGYVQRASDVARKEHIQSATKSLTSIAFGMARAQGFFDDLDEPLANILPIEDPRKQTITLRHLLTMRSGIGVDNMTFGTELLMPKRKHMTRWLLDQPLQSEPGERFDYRDCDPQLVGSAVLARTGSSVEDLIREQLFAPLGIVDTLWEHNADGEPLTAAGVWLRPRDFAKIGETVRNQGRWGGRSLIPADWLAAATVRHSDIASLDDIFPGFGYGYYFWTAPTRGAYAALGHGGTAAYVIPDERLVIVLTCMPYAGDDVASSLVDVAELADILLG